MGKQVLKKIDTQAWDRISHSGNTVSLTGGLTTVSALTTGLAATLPQRSSSSALVISSAGAIAGWIDDHMEHKFPARGKGFRGHLGALKQGKVTSGLLKIATIGAGATLAALIAQTPASSQTALTATAKAKYRKFTSQLAHIGADSLILAGSANFVNLLDLRPGRALKVASLTALPGLLCKGDARTLSAVILTTSVANLPTDLSGHTMLGDMGANALGGVVGTVLTTTKSLPVKLLVLGTISGLTLASEKISFSEVIDNNSVLSYLDGLGRK
ncbi:UDP-N-acetylmuramyl pentapeptide phosphotransferase/UDP-N-acetylglucosamine-1-phosphate transferase [Arcanobacterium pluranimalium]|uniref:hypothetical protein n=1 Tax=Arcanobacterium pluranimalium TaxID=108028 RepID=UPI00195805A6|nr:hypothetical protein [Arcanobacterium pluranimalium]MBM7825329.1 UDP-N-acetylmuramyl pentapeptide phosphotransferase/UDP-N-acetylglucosamine-1-phosphate transferase [Arcanobacterium pluranimalium]